MVNFESRNKYGVYDLQKLVSLLRSPDGCPWDREQTHGSIRRNLLEEAYEAAEAIDEGDPAHLCEELGDVLTQVVFHADIEADAGRFDLDGVADRVCRKLLLRHPHVFGDATVESSDEVLRNWDEIKRVEKEQDTVSDALDAVAKSLPALWRAEKLQKKAAKVVPALNAPSDGAQDLGRALFNLVNAARLSGVDPEEALNRYCDGFTERFRALESSGSDLKTAPAERLL
jgi:tetrapyrrole methylase family protein/MazG family protein